MFRVVYYYGTFVLRYPPLKCTAAGTGEGGGKRQARQRERKKEEKKVGQKFPGRFAGAPFAISRWKIHERTNSTPKIRRDVSLKVQTYPYPPSSPAAGAMM